MTERRNRIERMDFDRSDSSLKISEALREEPEVKIMLAQKGLLADDLQFKGIEVSNWLTQKHICEACPGLDSCNRPMKGYGIELSQSLSEVMKPCRYLAQKQKKTEHRRNYLMCDLNEKALLYDIDKIDLSGEKADYSAVVSEIKNWLRSNSKRGFYFHGGLGVGKTYLAACIANHMAKKGKSVAFVNVPKLASDLRNNIKVDDYVSSRVSRMRKADLLVLDDIGAENMSDWFRDDILFTVLDYRMEHEKLTVFTSNSDLTTLQRRMMTSSSTEDETKALRIIERIRALSVNVPMRGTSRRSI
ncbi:MAG: ATP-binding protein [Erysipelotrichaceae bacterium]|nr:ATP-binding protein [Erysipelotrichaceae bacterium]